MPPVKDRLEQPLPSLDERLGGLSMGTLSLLHKQVIPCTEWCRILSLSLSFSLLSLSLQLGPAKTVTVADMTEKWRDAGLAQNKLEELIAYVSLLSLNTLYVTLLYTNFSLSTNATYVVEICVHRCLWSVVM